ncbi:MAG TPA: DUF6519 domain-containing protein, partial [Pyrinomonadaceae bacterium]|nr:DUF6519 domain-containing protein [Pyrinomonadaceae bacterium]
MKGDFTRVTFDPAKHYSRVLMQQGRVQLDADWNEQAAILLHYLQALAADLIGPFGGPDGNLLGFGLSDAEAKTDFTIGAGHYYVDGLLCENDGNVSYFKQRDYEDDYSSAKRRTKLPKGNYLAYLDVWEHHVISLEDNHIREVALGGPDTATRARVVWQVKLDATDGQPTAAEIYKNWGERVNRWQPAQRGSLRVRLKPTEPNTDPCTIPPTSAYRGQENQLYRVEIHGDGKLADEPSFKWSRDNGATVANWEGNSEDDGLILSSVRGFAKAPWVEITSAADDLHGRVGDMLKVVKVENDMLYLEKPQAWSEGTLKKVRRWDQNENETVALKDGVVPVTEGTGENAWIDLEDGIQVQFQPPDSTAPNQYRAGDYWLIPARTNGTIEWPFELEVTGQPKKDAGGNLIPQALAP